MTVQPGRLSGKNCIVTGSGSGIGRAIATLFAREGASITVADFNLIAARETVENITEDGGTAWPYQVDVSQATPVEALVKEAYGRAGRLDILVNNAGVGVAGTVVTQTEDDFDRMYAVNVRGMFLGCKYAIPLMVEQGGGIIVNMASVAGIVGILDRAGYCASKGAVIALTRSVSADFIAQGIRANCICPGTIDSPWVERITRSYDDPAAARAAMVARQPVGRMGTPDEIAHAALYLASDEAGYVQGSALIIDGGITAR